ncbi:AfsR family transcriptional regulator [Nonomuraea sp. NN258]|uniref:AfsR/SARP family transcriptional regulator n=1 Tax=Nonomuraea antri TaxID=2730852 RepID=UPI001568551B|nr:BTAD domain-containing putative transcriptional regulator [Nonomuraea antri]NRQ34291.1 AfsR family transcriptional regulator [Nonomuraea antri]
MLLCRANTAVPTAKLATDLWDESPPAHARKNIQTYVSLLRKIVGDRVRNVGYGYMINVAAEELDWLRFQGLAAAGRRSARAGDQAAAARLLREAILLRKATPLADLLDSPSAIRESEQLELRFLTVYEDWAELAVALAQYDEVLTSSEEIVATYPHRDRVCAARMLALARIGRVQEALSLYEERRQQLARDLGLDPSPMLRRRYAELLDQDTSPAQQPRPPNRLPSAPVRIPPRVIDFAGRTHEIQALTGLLHEDGPPGGAALVAGPIGVGKTTLAVHVAHLMHAQFPDGVVVVTLHDANSAPLPTGRVLRNLLHIIGLDLGTEVEYADAVAIWRSWLAEHRMLIILDDAPNEASVRALLPSFGGSRVIITSRMKLSALDSVLRLDLQPFTVQEGLDLLSRITGMDRVLSDRSGAERLLHACDLLPLAIRAAGARLLTLPYLSCGGLATRLERTSPSQADELDVGDISVKDIFAQGLLRLPPALLTATRALASLPTHTFTLDELTLLVDDPDRVLETLMEAHVITCPPGDVSAHSVLFSLSPMTHKYAAEPVGDPRPS